VKHGAKRPPSPVTLLTMETGMKNSRNSTGLLTPRALKKQLTPIYTLALVVLILAFVVMMVPVCLTVTSAILGK
jgi:hypothetical protein